MKRVLVYCPYYPPHMGGLESHADEFNKYLSAQNFDITVFTPRLPVDGLEREAKYNNVKIIRFPAFEIIPNYPLPQFWNIKFWKLWSEVFVTKYDWVISRTRFFNTALMALMHSKIKKIKWMHIEHGSDFVKLNNIVYSKIAEIYDKTFGLVVLKLANIVVANSVASAMFCKIIFSDRKYEVIYRGIEIEKINKIKPKILFKNKFVILYTGRLIDGKGVGDLIAAVLKIKNDKWVLLIVGDGPKRSEWEKMANNQIKFLGQKPNSELVGVMKGCNLVVNPSYTEGLPTSMVEATVCGVPVIATDVGGTREIVEDGVNGYLVKPKNVDELQKRIEEMMKNKFIIKKVVNKFDWRISINKYIKLLS